MPPAAQQSWLDRPHGLSSWLGMCRVIVGRLRGSRLAEAIGLFRRRRLISRRRIGQRTACRFARKTRRLFLLVAAEKRADAFESELGRHHLTANSRGRRLVPVVGAGRFFRVATGGHLIRPQWILLALAFVADIAVLLQGCPGLAALHVYILRPGWIVSGNGIAPFGRGQLATGRNYQRRTLPIVDHLFAVAFQAEPFHNAAHEFLIYRNVVIARAGWTAQK